MNKKHTNLNKLIKALNNCFDSLDSSKVVQELAKVDIKNPNVSSKDLAKAIKRVGAASKNATISCDRLINLITKAFALKNHE